MMILIRINGGISLDGMRYFESLGHWVIRHWVIRHWGIGTFAVIKFKNGSQLRTIFVYA